jgi:hypothetical protein
MIGHGQAAPEAIDRRSDLVSKAQPVGGRDRWIFGWMASG